LKNSAGFAVLELLIVLSLITLSAGLGLAWFSVFDRFMIRLELDTLYTHCMRLQQEAQLTGQTKELIFDHVHHSYEIGQKWYVLSSHVRFAERADIQGPPSQRKGHQQGITFIKDKILFYPDGIISSGTVYITDKAKKYLYALSVGVSQVSYIRKYVYQNGWVILT